MGFQNESKCLLNTLTESFTSIHNNGSGLSMKNELAQVIINLIKTFRLIIHSIHVFNNIFHRDIFSGHHVEHIRPPESVS